jgi:hypothetical protein
LLHNNYWIAKCYTCLHALNAWSALMLILGYIVKDYPYNHQIFMWLIGNILIAIIIFIRYELRYEITLIDTNNYEVLE